MTFGKQKPNTFYMTQDQGSTSFSLEQQLRSAWDSISHASILSISLLGKVWKSRSVVRPLQITLSDSNQPSLVFPGAVVKRGLSLGNRVDLFFLSKLTCNTPPDIGFNSLMQAAPDMFLTSH